MESDSNTNDVLPYLENLKISAFKKVDLIKNQIQNVTIGPSSNLARNEIPKVETSYSSKKNHVKTANKIEAPTIDSEGIESNSKLIPINQILKEYEFVRQQKVQEAIQIHSKKFELFSSQQNINKKNSVILQQRKHEEKMQQYEEDVKLALKEYDQEKMNEQKIMVQYQQKIDCERKKIVAAIEAKRKETELLNHCINKQSEFQSIFREIMVKIMSCQEREITEHLTESWTQCKDLNDLMTALIEKYKEQSTEKEQDMIEMILKRIKELKSNIDNTMESYKEKKEKVNNDLKTVSDLNEIPSLKVETESITPPLVKCIDSSSNLPISLKQQNVYTEIIEYHDKFMDSLKEFSNLDEFKQFRFDCKKAVNLSVNTISATSFQHLHDKYIKLSNLLSGKKTVIGDLQIIASKHPKGIPYCIDLLAKKFVLQGDLMVSCNPESAFAFATIIVSIWNECPDFGRILLACFFRECVYLVPFYPSRIINQTDQEYYKSMGYRYTDDKVEDQDKFLKRMTGTMRLYFAILISTPKRSQSNHPYFIDHAWVWLVSVLKLKPELDITATMLHTCFETIGFEMQKVYGKQFLKLMKFFIDVYFPLMKQIDTGGPVTRLECLMNEFKENGHKFQVPKGLLPGNFW